MYDRKACEIMCKTGIQLLACDYKNLDKHMLCGRKFGYAFFLQNYCNYHFFFCNDFTVRMPIGILIIVRHILWQFQVAMFFFINIFTFQFFWFSIILFKQLQNVWLQYLKIVKTSLLYRHAKTGQGRVVLQHSIEFFLKQTINFKKTINNQLINQNVVENMWRCFQWNENN